MSSNPKLSVAIGAILAGRVAGLAHADPTGDLAEASAGSLQEIVVTAQRRTQSIQDVPISLQVFTSQGIKALNISTFDDYLRYLPNVTAASSGPGQNEIFFRGLSSGVQSTQGSGETGLPPNVAVYLDDQAGQAPNRNLDIYAADLERIEVLEGPQGTLFGSGAEAGTVRYITNKPKLNVTEGSVEGGYGVTAGGDPNSNVTAVLNIPLIPDTLAVRGVIYDDSRGGYIDNVPATFRRSNTDAGIHYANYPAVNGHCPNGLPNNGFCVPPGSPTISNDSEVRNAINPVTYQGIRVEALYQINDRWNILLTQMYQNIDAEGVFYQNPDSSDGVPLQPLQVTTFNPSYNKDKFETTALTVNGEVGFLKLVYTGSYLDRKSTQAADYTNYARGVYGDYYQCYGPGSGGFKNPLKPTCFSPSAFFLSNERNEHFQNEFRVSTPDDWRIRGIVGAYYEDNQLFDVTDWHYRSLPPCTSNGAAGTPGNTGCLSNVGTLPGTTVQFPGVQSDTTSFNQDALRTTKQTAFFASVDFDIIPKVLTLTAGTRHFVFNNSLVGSVDPSFFCFQKGALPGGCTLDSVSLNADNLRDTESGFRSRGNLTWHITPDVLVYYTYSQGFRPGGFNQTGGAGHVPGPDGVNQYLIPYSYRSDQLINNEFGWKTAFFNHRLQWNGAIYQENWNDVQVSFFAPDLIGNLYNDLNGQNFRIRGIETSLVAQVTDGLTLQGSASWNQSVQTNSPGLVDNNPLSVNYGKVITQNYATGVAVPVNNPFGPIGSPSANAPPAQFSLRARYDWSFEPYKAFVQFGATHSDHSFTQAGSNPALSVTGAITSGRTRFEIPSYSTFDASLGVAKDAWNFELYIQNLSNSHAYIYATDSLFIVEQTPLRPRVIGGKFGYKF